MEFLELISRVALDLFKESEMEEETLLWKIEHVLSELFRVNFGTKLARNVVIVDEFSDSDDDY